MGCCQSVQSVQHPEIQRPEIQHPEIRRGALRLVPGAVSAVPEKLRVHASQRLQRSWAATNDRAQAPGVAAALRLRVARALALVRVSPALYEQQGVAARVSVSSEHAETLEAVRAAIVDGATLEISTATELRPGALVVVVEVGVPAALEQLQVSGPSDLVLESNVLARGPDAVVDVVASDRSRVFVCEDGDKPLVSRDTRLVAESSARIYFRAATPIAPSGSLSCVVDGDGAVHVSTPGVQTAKLKLDVLRGRGGVYIDARDTLSVETVEASVGKAGSVVLRTSPSRRFDVTCSSQSLDAGGGLIDVAAVASETVRARAHDGGRVVARPHGRLFVDSDAHSVVECVGHLPSSVVQANQLKVSSVAVTPLDLYYTQATYQLMPEVPTIRRAFRDARHAI